MNTPEKFDVIIIGGGKGGKTLATDLGHHGVKTAMIERSADMIGGTCINVACIPTKTLIASARAADAARHASRFGVATGEVTVDWPAVRQRAEGVVAAMRAMNHKNLTSAPSLEFILGTGRFAGPHSIEVRELSGKVRTLTAEKIFINTGTRPAKSLLPGLEEAAASNSETIQKVEQLPRHLVVLGGSYIALEFAQMFRRFGSKVTVIERAPQLLRNEDADVVDALAKVLRDEGIEFRVNANILCVERDAAGVAAMIDVEGKPERVVGSHLLAALGRSPNTEDLNLTVACVQVDGRGFIKVNERLETSVPGVWALGDVNGGPQFTHASLEDYRIVKANAFGGSGKRARGDRPIPFTLFTEPELARIGLTEKEARRQGADVKISKIPVAAIPRAKTMGESRGLIKVIVEAKTERILGCAILSVEAGEMLGAVQAAMAGGLSFTDLRDMVFSHPTLVEGFNNLPAAS
jgi:pyruvate/2-oxoglutarate dehydrogenase complex dihydrolipoamide dehydrogenase (E3) component